MPTLQALKEDLPGPVLTRFITRTFRNDVPRLQLPVNSPALGSTASENARYASDVVLRAYQLVNRFHSLPRMQIMSADHWDALYDETPYAATVGLYWANDGTPDVGDLVRVRDGPLGQAISVGFHECGERELVGAPATDLAHLLGRLLSPSGLVVRAENEYSDVLSTHAPPPLSHEYANALQVLLTERCELDGEFDGALRQANISTIDQGIPPASRFVREYVRLARSPEDPAGEWFRRFLGEYLPTPPRPE